ncbi:MAG: GAF domain-containing protein [Chloroflexota bacterium]
MVWVQLPFVLLLFLTTAMAIAIALYAFQRRRTPGASYFGCFMLVLAFWAFVYALELSTPIPEVQTLWLRIRYLGILPLPATLLLFALAYSGQGNYITPRLTALLCIEPAITILLILTNQQHGLFWRQITLQQIGSYSGLLLSYGPVFWAHAVYTYAIITLSMVPLFRNATHQTNISYRKIRILLLGILSPLLANVLTLLHLFPLPFLDLTPFSFSFSCLATFLAIIQMRFLEILPAAQHLLTEEMLDGVVVLDNQDRILYLNKTAREILADSKKEVIGQFIGSIYPAWKQLSSRSAESLAGNAPAGQPHPPIIVGAEHDGQSYEVARSPVRDTSSLHVGSLVIWHNVTHSKHTETLLRRQLEELTILHAIATTCVEASDEGTLISSVIRTLSEGLAIRSLAVFLMDENSGLLLAHPVCTESTSGRPIAPVEPGQGSIGQAAQTGALCYIPDIQKASDRQIHPYARSALSVPIRTKARVIGVLSAERAEIDAFTAEDERLLATTTSQLAIALERLRAEDSEHRRVQELLAITRIGTEIASLLDQQQVLDSIVRHAAEISRSGASGLFAYHPNRRFFLVAAYGVNEAFIDRINTEGIPLEGTAVGRAVAERRPYQIPDVREDPTYATPSVASMENIRSILALPMLRGEEIVGGIVIWHRQPRNFTKEEELFLQALAQQSVTAIENARLFALEREQRKFAEVLRDTGAALTASLNLDEILDQLLDQLARLVPYDAANVSLVEEGQARVVRQRGYETISERCSQIVANMSLPIAATPNFRRMFETRQPMVIPDTSHDPDWIMIDDEVGERSWAGAPIIVNGTVIAFFSLDKHQLGFYQPAQSEQLANFAGQAGLALQNALLFGETRRRASQQEAINQIITAAVTAPDLPSLLETALDVVLGVLDVNQGGLWIADQYALRGLPESVGYASSQYAQFTGDRFPRTITIRDWQQVRPDDPLANWKSHMLQFHLRAMLFVPVMIAGKRIGAISLVSPSPRQWTEDEVALLEAVGRQLGSAVERLDLLAKTQEQARQVQQIIDTVPEGVLLLDADRRIMLANPSAWQNLSYLVEQIQFEQNGEGPRLSHLAGWPIETLMKASSEENWQTLTSLPGTEANAPQRIFEVAARPVEAESRSAGWVLVLRDVTIERENQVKAQMQERLATVGQLAAGIAHDFNNILAAILVYVDLLAMEPSQSNTDRERLHIVQHQIQRAASLIRQILDFSRRSVMEEIHLDLLPFLKELEKLLARLLPENIRLSLAYQPGTYQVKADPTRLQQALMNISLNARDAMPNGGTLHYELEKVSIAPGDKLPVPDLSASDATSGEWIRIRIRDTGTGMPAEILPRIFDPFFTTKPVGQGTGLGLAQVYGIIKQHRGSIDVHSKPGEGSTFVLYLPALQLEPRLSEESYAMVREPTKLGSGETVMVVEDDPATCQAVTVLLENQNFSVITASNGKQALQVYENSGDEISLVVSDVVMPEMGGVALYQALQARRPGLKVLFITGHPLDIENQVLLEEGCVLWLQKPFSAHQFNAALSKILKT